MSKPITAEQRQSLKKLFDRHVLAPFKRPGDFLLSHKVEQANYLQFRRSVQRECYGDALMVKTPSGMWIGVEPDGHCHT